MAKKRKYVKASEKRKMPGHCKACGEPLGKHCYKCWVEIYCEQMVDGSFVVKKPDDGFDPFED